MSLDQGLLSPKSGCKIGHNLPPTFKFLQVHDPLPFIGWSQKLVIFFVRLNFIKYCPIFKLISLLESEENL